MKKGDIVILPSPDKLTWINHYRIKTKYTKGIQVYNELYISTPMREHLGKKVKIKNTAIGFPELFSFSTPDGSEWFFPKDLVKCVGKWTIAYSCESEKL